MSEDRSRGSRAEFAGRPVKEKLCIAIDKDIAMERVDDGCKCVNLRNQ